VIAAAALCPWPPLLVRELTGADPVLPELRAACAAAVAAMLAAGPDLVAVQPMPVQGTWDGVIERLIHDLAPSLALPG